MICHRRKVRLIGWVVALTSVLLVTGCGAVPTTAHSPIPSVRPPETTVIQAPLVMTATGRGLESNEWRLVHASAAQREIIVQADQGSGCSKPLGLRVVQSVRSVTIWSYSRALKSSTPCLSYRYRPYYRVHLDAPLGTRKVLHGH